MFDTTCANRSKWSFECGAPNRDRLPGRTCVGGIVWEEHCVECGQPECFRMCRMYERSYDGKCKRFESGIVPFRLHGHLMFGCDFRKWAKLEGRFSGGLSTLAYATILSALDRFVSRIMQAINRLMAFVPGRIGAITIYRRLKLWTSKAKNRYSKSTVCGLVLRCRASRAVKLHLSLIRGDEGVHEEVFELNGDWQMFNVSFSPVPKDTRFLLFTTEDTPFKLVFDTLELLAEPLSKGGDNNVIVSVPRRDPAQFVKCLAWDLDNTLWKGILVEDGPDELVLNEAAVELIKTLDSRGIINTILSKNDDGPTRKVLEKFGIADYFVFPAINWLPKSTNLVATAKTINIGLDTFAFIDDSPFERGEVGEKLPMVRIFKNTEIVGLASRPEFNPPVSGEGSRRRLSYQKEMQRAEAAKLFDGDYAAFLKSCEIVLTLFPLRNAEAEVHERCYELVQRTNQLTLAGRRYSPSQFSTLISQGGIEPWGIRCKDRFGDYGIVGVVVGRRDGAVWSVEEFVMSCRVAKKQCEYSVVHALAKKAQAEGVEMLKTKLVSTGRNTALISAFDEMPFSKTATSDDKNAFCYELKINEASMPDSLNKVVFQ